MRLPSPRFLIGLVLVLVACVTVAVLVTREGEPPTVAIDCIGGSEKAELMASYKAGGLPTPRTSTLTATTLGQPAA